MSAVTSGSIRDLLFETDEFTEAVQGLRKFSESLGLVLNDPYEWKWALIVLKNTLQALMVCVLKGTAGLEVLTKNAKRKWLDAYKKNLPYPEECLDYFKNLYKKIQGSSMESIVFSRRFKPSGSQDESVSKLIYYRNQFEHFTPKTLVAFAPDFLKIAKDCLDIVEFLVKDSSNFNPPDESQEAACLSLLKEAREKIGGIEGNYDSITSQLETRRK